MKILAVRIRRYRCLRDVSIEVEDYTALVGPNGSGKSSVLYALDWFFNGTALHPDDFHTTNAEPSDETQDQEIDVEVTFGDLDDEDRRILAQYGRGETVRFRRSWSRGSASDKMIGNSRQGPGFAPIRADTAVTRMRPIYKKLRQEFPDLADVSSKEDILAQLAAWEDRPENAEKLVEVPSDDATHLFGFNGEHVLARRIRLVLVPASADISDHTAMSGKTSAAARLIGALISEAVNSAKSDWEAENAEQLRELADAIREGVEASTSAQAGRVNSIFATLVPGAEIDFVPRIPDWVVKGEASVQTAVLIDGERKDVGRQGHGVQRAVIIAMLQALIPDETSAKASVGEGDEAALDEAIIKLPALIICVEEPEIYQHPVRSRHFARVLARWAERERSQVLLATHSPYFVLPSQFQSLRRFCLRDGASAVTGTQVGAVAAAAGVPPATVERVVEKEIPHTFSEGFFAEAVVFVEGDTDRVVMEATSENLGAPLDAAGVAVIAAGGKGNLRVQYEMLRLIGVPVYVIADGDALGGVRSHPSAPAKASQADASHKKQTESLLEWLPAPRGTYARATSVTWGDPTFVSSDWALLHDDLETELETWGSFQAELKANGHLKRSKNVAAYRAAATDADLSDIPPALVALVSQISKFHLD